MGKTSIQLDKSLLENIEGNKSQFIRDAINDKLSVKISTKSEINIARFNHLELQKKLLEFEIQEIEEQMERFKTAIVLA